MASLVVAALEVSEIKEIANVPTPVLLALSTLTQRELEVLHLIANGLTTRQIAEQLFISPHTVNNQRAQISQKLGLQGAFSLLQFAQRYHLILSQLQNR